MSSRRAAWGLLFLTAIAVGVGYIIGCALSEENAAEAASGPGVSPTKARRTVISTSPGAKTWRRTRCALIACGTGMPTARPKQAASCWLVELGNGDKFLFDLGTGSAERIAALQIPYNYLDKIFLSHLHTDHFGDLDALFVGGVAEPAARNRYGFGDRAAIRPETGHDVRAGSPVQSADLGPRRPQGNHRSTRIPTIRSHRVRLQGRERDHLPGERRHDSVTIPAIHILDGPVSFILEWNGLKFVFGGDTYPNKWYEEYAKDADLAIHECFITVPRH